MEHPFIGSSDLDSDWIETGISRLVFEAEPGDVDVVRV
jgi:hypothetical protein